MICNTHCSAWPLWVVLLYIHVLPPDFKHQALSLVAIPSNHPKDVDNVEVRRARPEPRKQNKSFDAERLSHQRSFEPEVGRGAPLSYSHTPALLALSLCPPRNKHQHRLTRSSLARKPIQTLSIQSVKWTLDSCECIRWMVCRGKYFTAWSIHHETSAHQAAFSNIFGQWENPPVLKIAPSDGGELTGTCYYQCSYVKGLLEPKMKLNSKLLFWWNSVLTIFQNSVKNCDAH